VSVDIPPKTSNRDLKEIFVLKFADILDDGVLISMVSDDEPQSK
jgi:hypothetical protein